MLLLGCSVRPEDFYRSGAPANSYLRDRRGESTCHLPLDHREESKYDQVRRQPVHRLTDGHFARHQTRHRKLPCVVQATVQVSSIVTTMHTSSQCRPVMITTFCAGLHDIDCQNGVIGQMGSICMCLSVCLSGNTRLIATNLVVSLHKRCDGTIGLLFHCPRNKLIQLTDRHVHGHSSDWP